MTQDAAQKLALDLIEAASTSDALRDEDLQRRLKALRRMAGDAGSVQISLRLLARREEILNTTTASALRACLESFDKPGWTIEC